MNKDSKFGFGKKFFWYFYFSVFNLLEREFMPYNYSKSENIAISNQVIV